MTTPTLAQIRRGEPIRARWLNTAKAQIDELRARVGSLVGTDGTQALDTDPGNSNLSPAQLLDPTLTAPSVTRGLGLGNAYVEIARLVSVVRVENPDDAAQFVDVERIEAIAFENDAGERLSLVLANG